QRSDIDKAVNVVGPAVQKNDYGPVCGTGLGVSNVQDTGIDLLERSERSIRSRLDRRQLYLSCRAGLRLSRTDYAELSGRRGHSSGTNEVTSMPVYFFCFDHR